MTVKSALLISVFLAAVLLAGCGAPPDDLARESESATGGWLAGNEGNATAKEHFDSISLQDCRSMDAAAYAQNDRADPYIPDRFGGTGLLPGHTTVLLRPLNCAGVVFDNQTLIEDAWMGFLTLAVTDSEGELDNGIFQLQLVLEVWVADDRLYDHFVAVGLPVSTGWRFEDNGPALLPVFSADNANERHELQTLVNEQDPRERGVLVGWHLLWPNEDKLRILQLDAKQQEAESFVRPATWSFESAVMSSLFGSKSTEGAQAQRQVSTYAGTVGWVE